jgi:hypothetical protein
MTTKHHLLTHHRVFIDEQHLTFQQSSRRKKPASIHLESISLFSLLVLLSLIQLSVASLPCKLGLEYWDPKQDTCIKCSKCDEQMIVIRPCQPHQDVACGTINELDIDWSWFKKLENRKVCFMTVFHFLGNFRKILYSREIERNF